MIKVRLKTHKTEKDPTFKGKTVNARNVRNC